MATARVASVVAVLCLSLLVAQFAHVDGARLLKQSYDPVEATASTFPAEETPVGEIFTESTDVAEPVTTDPEYNYNTLDTAPEEVVATEEADADEEVFAADNVVGEATPRSQEEDQSYVFDAQRDEEVVEPDFTTPQDFEPLDAQADAQDVVAHDPSFAVQSSEFDLEETSDPGAFAFDDSLPPPFGN